MTRPRTTPHGDTLLVRAGRLLATLQLAVVLLSLFTLCLAGATWIESAYGARAAQVLVYRAWWFALLLALLAVNVVGAALKKYPWKRHQTGFLVTHAGLLVLLLGGLLSTLFGVEGQMVLVDTPSAELQARLGLSDHGSSIQLDGLHEIDVFRLRQPAGAVREDVIRLVGAIDAGRPVPNDLRNWVEREWSFSIEPGVFTWTSDERTTRRLPWALDLLDRLASPWPCVTQPLDGDTILTVSNFYPHVEGDPHAPAGIVPRDVRPGSDAAERLSPALRCTLTAHGRKQEFVVAMFRGAVPLRVGDALYLVRYRPATHPVDFTLTLQRAWQVKDPGSDRPAWFQSDVTLTTSASRAEPLAASVSMNCTLGHGLYKVYQANYRRLTDDKDDPILEDGRAVSVSGLAIAHDPGLWFKYAGSLGVVAGIAMMFWMRAYFFRPRGEHRPAGTPTIARGLATAVHPINPRPQSCVP